MTQITYLHGVLRGKEKRNRVLKWDLPNFSDIFLVIISNTRGETFLTQISVYGKKNNFSNIFSTQSLGGGHGYGVLHSILAEGGGYIGNT